MEQSSAGIVFQQACHVGRLIQPYWIQKVMVSAEITQPDAHVAHVFPRALNRQIHGLRGLAALLVFGFHIYSMAVTWTFWPNSLNGLSNFMLTGRHGVEIFFIISGYLITGSLIRHRNVGQFLLDRAIRIYPVFLTIQMLVFLVGPVIHYKWLSGITLSGWCVSFLENLLFLPGIFDLPLAQLNAWSLSYEAAFYLISGGAYLFARRAGKPATAIVLVLIMAPLFFLYPKASYFLIGTGIFFIGAPVVQLAPRMFRLLSLPSFFLTLLLLTLSEWSTLYCYLGCIPAFFFFANIVTGEGALSRALRIPLLQYTGTISYSFYLWSAMATYPLKIAISRLPQYVSNEIRLAVFTLSAIIVSYVISHFSHRYLEDAARKYIKRSLGRAR